MERQKHGFTYEDAFREKWDALPVKGYTSPFDAVLHGLPAQIKTVKLGGEICLGDYRRHMNVDCDFILHIGWWSGSRDNIVEEMTFFVEATRWQEEFAFPQFEEAKEEFRLITNLREDDDRFHQMVQKYQPFFEGRMVKIRFKRDHKRQKRIQAAIPARNVVLLKRNFPPYSLINPVGFRYVVPEEKSHIEIKDGRGSQSSRFILLDTPARVSFLVSCINTTANIKKEELTSIINRYLSYPLPKIIIVGD